MSSRWEFAYELELYSSFFDIRFKNLNFVLEQEKQDFIKTIHTEYKVLCSVLDIQINQHILPNSNQKEISIIEKLFAKKNANISLLIKDEFDKYLEISELQALEENNLLIW
ncbi:6045_t:CDS:2 [Scutellospora calospora]|uniref:6045_t:CDS:1 n=1 Tax=Scutellospora calospora TaxID=85575 RepID=A0ACA9KZF5_9GLOM|nr:6045_t:CDS:2 [Scutellospora calospora]